MRARRALPLPTETSYSVSGSRGSSTTARIPPRLMLSVQPDVSSAFARITTRSDASCRAPPACRLWLGGLGVFGRFTNPARGAYHVGPREPHPRPASRPRLRKADGEQNGAGSHPPTELLPTRQPENHHGELTLDSQIRLPDQILTPSRKSPKERAVGWAAPPIAPPSPRWCQRPTDKRTPP